MFAHMARRRDRSKRGRTAQKVREDALAKDSAQDPSPVQTTATDNATSTSPDPRDPPPRFSKIRVETVDAFFEVLDNWIPHIVSLITFVFLSAITLISVYLINELASLVTKKIALAYGFAEYSLGFARVKAIVFFAELALVLYTEWILVKRIFLRKSIKDKMENK